MNPVVKTVVATQEVDWLHKVLVYLVDFGVVVSLVGILVYLIWESHKNKISLVETLRQKPAHLFGLILITSTMIEIASLTMIAANNGDTLTAALGRNVFPGSLEIFGGFIFSYGMSAILEDGKFTASDWFSVVIAILGFSMSLTATTGLWYLYLESIGNIVFNYGEGEDLFTSMYTKYKINLGAVMTIWCTPVLNILMVFFYMAEAKINKTGTRPVNRNPTRTTATRNAGGSSWNVGGSPNNQTNYLNPEMNKVNDPFVDNIIASKNARQADRYIRMIENELDNNSNLSPSDKTYLRGNLDKLVNF